ncbi:hypothetical protein LMG27174_03711 [Paraburkholderia rhynchosiae]|uniref:Uncharacterized protein n=1 Tax=Paraburkholderia rhynchosiae TaxID=487049 RepID=A0A6J5BFF0_9BURK|nr:hypothetical protein LMG27174_03711 [Paraburkholderia rhynchosiae]
MYREIPLLHKAALDEDIYDARAIMQRRPSAQSPGGQGNRIKTSAFARGRMQCIVRNSSTSCATVGGCIDRAAVRAVHGRVPSLCPAGVDQAQRAAICGSPHDVECTAATYRGLLRAGVRTRWALNQRGRASVRQKERRAAAAAAQRGARCDGQHGEDAADEGREAPVHLKPRSRLVFRSRDCATRQLRCVTAA